MPETVRASSVISDSQADEVVGCLETLMAELNGKGLAARIVRAGHPFVHAASGTQPRLSEKVYAAPAQDGSSWYWWSWGDPIAPAGEAAQAAVKIARVLAVPDAGVERP